VVIVDQDSEKFIRGREGLRRGKKTLKKKRSCCAGEVWEEGKYFLRGGSRRKKTWVGERLADGNCEKVK